MKLPINIFFSYSSLLIVLAVNNPSVAQKNKTWPSSLDYQLQGHVKSWTMRNETGVLRQQEFDSKGNLTKDTYKGTVQTYTPPEYLPQKLKVEFEKIYKDKSGLKDSTTRLVFNKRMQLIEKQTPNYHVINEFTDEGKILVNKTIQIATQTGAWNSYHDDPTYTFTDTVQFVVIYKYNQAGLLKEFEYYHSDPFENIRIVYLYDSAYNLIESNRYDQYNISTDLMPDNYLNKFADTEIDATFSINKFYKDYWNQGSPSKLTWKYNQKGQKIEYIAYGFQHEPSFKATWEYDDKGQLIKEIHYDVYHNTIRCEIKFDKKGNVIKETDFDYWAKKEYNFNYEIVYY
jgi:hypothetical protein